ncbi:MAG: tetratricopeptide repeat protein [Desulfuromonadia bacterium]
MQKENLVMVVIALIVGLLGGFLIFSISNKEKAPQNAIQNVPMGAGSPVDYQQRIAELEKIVAQNPNDRGAWVQLGNDYFDTSQPQKSVQAYQKALDLAPNDPANANILTDQGIMFRAMGMYDRAIANFEKARTLDPKHTQSVYNMGIVYATDLKQPDKAIKAFNEFLLLDSTSPQAQQVKQMIEEMKRMPAKK